jgi:rRNA-processing protein FCF1
MSLWQTVTMLITPRPGVSLDNLIQNLRTVHMEASSLRDSGSAPTAQVYVLDYLDWANRAARTLGSQIRDTDLASLVLNRRYEVLLSSFGTMSSPLREAQRVVRDLVRLELGERVKDFEAAVKTLEEQIQRWARLGVFVVADTSFYIEHEQKLQEANFATPLSVRGEPIHILVPIVVVDELDGLKQSKDKHVRWRAGHTLGVLDGVFTSTTGPAQLQAGDFSALDSGGIPRGEVTIELLFDPPGHVRLPINDDEIIDRAMAIEPLAARPVTLLTYDTGQSTRARAAGLQVIKLSEDIGEEPE